MKKLFCAFMLFILTGCVSNYDVLVKEGLSPVTCKSWGFGVTGVISANLMQDSCIRDYESQGYVLQKDQIITKPTLTN